MKFQNNIEFARQMDADDPLAHFRERFHIPQHKGEDCLYLCGNSLGLQPKSVREYVDQELQDWATFGVEGHFQARHPWMPYHEFLTEKTARLVGALPNEVVTMNSLTVNLHLMLVSFYRPSGGRYKILMEANAFPSDQYAIQSQVKYHGYDPDEAIIELPLRPGEVLHHPEDIAECIATHGNEIALILIGGVNYYTGQAFDMQTITRLGHTAGCLVGFDLAHAAGNLQLQLHDWQVDFAAWCSYKYLNSGPGGISGCFVHEKHADSDRPRFAGWWGHDKSTRFKMGPDYVPIQGAEGWQISNPPILPLAALRASLDIFDEAGMAALRKKSRQLTGYLAFLLKDMSREQLYVLTPEAPEQRGCQLSLVVPHNGRAVFEKLSERGIICDWREPDVIRIAPVPLYNSFTDAYRFAETIKELVKSEK